MSKLIIWSPFAEEDIESILEYLHSNWEGNVVFQFIETIDKITNQIFLNPKQFPLIHKGRRIRKCILTMHNTLFYRDRREYIDILRVYDTRKDPRKLRFQ